MGALSQAGRPTWREYLELAKAIVSVFQSVNEFDRNGEPANVVDAVYAHARSLDRLADVLENGMANIADVMLEQTNKGGSYGHDDGSG